MAKINLLPEHMSEVIAAGEVVERPASVIKELCENAIDAGATKITVEIQHGGITYMRVTDNGSGIGHEDVPTAFLRFATSKIRSEADIFNIGTLGFRGEALPSIAAVAKVEVITKTEEESFGTRFAIEGGVRTAYETAGCPNGTTIIVRDLFYNVPARMKFLKKDSTEAMYVMSLLDHLALCNPQVSIKAIRDSKLCFTSVGDGKLISSIYSVLGREYSAGLIPVNSVTGDITVSGFVSKPVHGRSTRGGQYFAVNGRMIKSGIAVKALEEAYKNAIMVGKFPCCVLNIELPFDRVDVNVHPSKSEVRFHDEKAFFEAVYYAVKNALVQGDRRPELELRGGSTPKKTAAEPLQQRMPSPFDRITAEQYKRISEKDKREAQLGYLQALEPKGGLKSNQSMLFGGEVNIPRVTEMAGPSVTPPVENKKPISTPAEKVETVKASESAREQNLTFAPLLDTELKYIGEAYKTYIIVQFEGSIYFIDKHAAHERILFEKLKRERTVQTQYLVSPVAVTLSREEHRAMLDNIGLLREAGFEIEEFGTVSVLVRAVPTELVNGDILYIICEVADKLLSGGSIENERLESLYHTVACRAAIKAGNSQSPAELEALAKTVLSNRDIMYCPHGRPVAFELKRSELERQFGRTN